MTKPVVQCSVTFTWPSEVSTLNWKKLGPIGQRAYIEEFTRAIHNDITNIVTELIAEERFTVDVRETVLPTQS